MKYIEYWDRHSKRIQEQLNSSNSIKSSNEIDEAKQIEFISLSISDFLQSLIEQKIVSFDRCKDSNFEIIFEYLDLDKDHIKKHLLEIDSLNDIDEKEAEIEKLFLKYPENDLILYYKAYLESVNKNNPKKALILWENYLDKNPRDVLALGYLSFIYKEQKKPKIALQTLSKALEMEPENYILHKNMGSLLFLLIREFDLSTDYKKALFHLEKAAIGNPDDYETFYKLGEVYLQGLFSFDNALECYERSILLKPDQVMPYVQSISVHVQKKNYKKAEKLIEKAKTYSQRDEKILTAEATLLIESGENPLKGIDLLYSIIEEYPKSFMTYIQLSKYLVELRNDFITAINLLLKAKKIVDEKKYIDIYLQELISKKSKDKSEANQHKKLVNYFVSKNYSKADSLIKKNDTEFDEKYKPIIYAIYNDWGLQLVDIAKQESNNKKINLLRKACNKFKRATYFFPNYYHAWGNWGSTLGRIIQFSEDYEDQDLENIFEKFEKATELNPNKFEIWNDWGNYLSMFAELKSNKVEKISILKEACEKFKKASNLQSNNYMVWYNWGKALATRAHLISDNKASPNLYTSAIEKLNQSISLQPDNYYALSLLGLAHLELAKMEKGSTTKHFLKASDALIKAKDLNPKKNLDLEISNCLFKASFSTGDNKAKTLKKKAIKYLKEAIKVDKNAVQTIKTNDSWTEILKDEDVKKIVATN